ncbi:hypothetical protein [Motiliproteus sp. SC1-56]|uniref:hypothetical protein n=1 Tax=Motiliproteus sp. SC1-56 TaxID=2799565 RepID=UPI001A8F9293|nr:hypothetical protein [Motiliproteus sp. SC1-56]
MNHGNRLNLRESCRLLSRLSLTEKDDQQIEELVELILEAQKDEEVHPALQHSPPD